MINRCFFQLYCLILIFGVSTYVQAQGQKIIPSSPEASTLAKSINFPVAHNTGIPDINVPLHQIRTPSGLELPVTMSYHAGGFKINEKSTSVGLGWSLSTSLQISRSIAGKDDFSTHPYHGYYFRAHLSMQSPPNHTIQDYFALLRGEQDEQPDAFYYKLLNKSGTFYFYKSQAGTTIAVTVPYTGVKIEVIDNINMPSGYRICFKITDTDGTVYWFGRNADDSNSQIATESTTSIPVNNPFYSSEISAWKCVTIISPNKADIIQFEYADKGSQFVYTSKDRVEVLESQNCRGRTNGGCPPAGGMPAIMGPHCSALGIYYPSNGTSNWNNNGSTAHWLKDSVSMYNMSTPRYFNYSTGIDAGFYVPWNRPDYFEIKKYEIDGTDIHTGRGLLEANVNVQDLQLSKIIFPGGRIDYNTIGGDVVNGAQLSISKLGAIKIYDNNSTLVKTINFFQSEAANCLSSTPYVQKLISPTRYLDSIVISKNGSGGTKESYTFEYENKFCFNYLKGSDSWGGVNASTRPGNSVSSVPFQFLQSRHFMENDCANETTIQYGIGEGNKLVDTTLIKSGILRKIIYPTGGSTVFKFAANRYKDQNNVLHFAGGLRVEKISHYTATNSQPSFEKIYKYGVAEDQIGILMSIPSVENEFGGYKYTQEVVYGQYQGLLPPDPWMSIATETKTTYTTDSFLDLYYSNGSPINYPEVAEYQMDNGIQTGKTIYDYGSDLYNGFSPSFTIMTTNLVQKANTWHLGKLQSEAHLKYLNGIYDTVKVKDYKYTGIQKEKVYVGQVFQRRIYQGVFHPPEQIYIYGVYSPVADYTSIPDEFHQTSDFLEVAYELNSGTLLLEKEVERWKETSGMLTKITEYQYGNELQVKQIKVSRSDGRKLITDVKYAKDYASGTAFIDDLKSNYMVNIPIETTISIDNGSSIGVVSGQIITYRSDNTGLPDKIFQLESTDPLSSFQFSNTTGFSPDTHYKEKLSYTYNGFKDLVTIQPKGGVSTNYIWGYKGQYPVAEIKNVDYNTVTLLLGGSAALSNFRNIPFPSISAVNILFMPLRNSLPEAQINTFTYAPLVGMTSSTDAKGMITYYEYDDLQRLIRVRDQNQNIIKQYCYNYAGQVTDCFPVTFSSVAKSETFTKNNCSSGNVGSQVTYTVPAGTYNAASQVAADALAQADVNANGQNYTNINGTCNPPPTIYARVELINPTGNGYYTDHDVYVNFYSDANCTLPFVPATNLNINYRISTVITDIFYGTGSSSSYTDHNVVVYGNYGQGYYLGNMRTSEWWQEYDPYYGYIDFLMDLYVDLLPGNYEIAY